MHQAEKRKDAALQEARHPVRYRVIDLDKTHMVSTINQPFEQLWLLKPKEAVSGELILEFHDVLSQSISVYRAVVTELEICVWRYPDGYRRELPVVGLDRIRLDQERFIFPKAFADKVLQGREGFVLKVDRMGVLSRAYYELPHEATSSVGGSDVGTSESTEGVQTPASPEMKMPSAAATAEGDETNIQNGN